jgi:hypothetical protein
LGEDGRKASQLASLDETPRVAQQKETNIPAASAEHPEGRERQWPKEMKPTQRTANQRLRLPVESGPSSKQATTGSQATVNQGNSATVLPPAAHGNSAASGDAQNGPANNQMNRSTARSKAITQVMGQLPPEYFGERRAIPAVVSDNQSDSFRWPEALGPFKGNSAIPSEVLTADRGDPTKVFKWDELPPQIQNFLSMYITMLVYAKSTEERLIVVNGSSMHEGQERAGLKLEEITRDGGIFSYQGYRFRKAVRGD